MITAEQMAKNEEFAMSEAMFAIKGIADRYGKELSEVIAAFKVEGSEINKCVTKHVMEAAEQLAKHLNELL